MRLRKRKTRVTVETERTFIFMSRNDKQSGWCVVCGTEAEMLALEAAAQAASVGELAICSRIEARSLHFTEAADGRVFICLNSLRR